MSTWIPNCMILGQFCHLFSCLNTFLPATYLLLTGSAESARRPTTGQGHNMGTGSEAVQVVKSRCKSATPSVEVWETIQCPDFQAELLPRVGRKRPCREGTIGQRPF